MNDSTIQILKEILRKEGLRYTKQRQAVWDEIQNSQKHRDAEDIYMSIRNNGVNVSRATVYRTIDVLVKNRMVRKMDVGDGRNRYEPRLDDAHHDHMICIETGKIKIYLFILLIILKPILYAGHQHQQKKKKNYLIRCP